MPRGSLNDRKVKPYTLRLPDDLDTLLRAERARRISADEPGKDSNSVLVDVLRIGFGAKATPKGAGRRP